VPDDNPFANDANNPDAAPEVWSYGHRNPQGLAIQPGTGLLFEQEHGPTGGDEINIIVRAKNYGWPVITYGEDIWGDQLPEGTAREGMEQPFAYFKPGIAPSGLSFYTGSVLPTWQGDLFNSTLRGHVTRLQLGVDNAVLTEERLVGNWGERIRDVVQGPDDYLYLATESGKIARIRLEDK
jgi:glucose/arabinose dehydrogenase